ncbi:MAG: FAD:protein FMN transferase [Saprospiraceae bacterium]|nr:FAD:protein FMN transferase [Saprospiraceae bacterium]
MYRLLTTITLYGFVALLLPRYAGAQTEAPLKRFTFSHPQMGTLFNISLYAADSSQARKAADAAKARIDEINNSMSDYMPTSELSKLSMTAGSKKAVPVSEPLWLVLSASQELAVQTKGAFDVTVGPLSKMWRKAIRQKTMPAKSEISTARKSVGYKKMQLNAADKSVQLNAPNMQLDLGAIAKGYALDEALKAIEQHQVSRALIQGGGDLIAGDAPPGQPGWQIFAKWVTPQGQLRDTLLLVKRCAVATSGALFRFFESDGKRYSHIIDPRTGMGVTHAAMVSVQAPTAMQADALATAVSVMGPRKGFAWLQKNYKAIPSIVTFQEKGKPVQLGALRGGGRE